MARAKDDNIYVKVAAPILAAAGYARIGASWIKETGDGIACRVSIHMNMQTHSSYHIEIGVGIKDQETPARKPSYSWLGVTRLEDGMPRKQRLLLREALHIEPRPIITDFAAARKRASAIEAGIRRSGMSMLTPAQARRAIDASLKREALRAEVQAHAREHRGPIVADAIARHAIPILTRMGSRRAIVAAYRWQILRNQRIPVFGSYDPRKASTLVFDSQPTPAAKMDLPAVDGDGRRLTNRALKGRKATLLHVWDPSSPASLAAHAVLKKIEAAGLARIYGLSTADDPEPARGFLRRRGNPYELCAHGGAAWHDDATPRTLLLDRTGAILGTFRALSGVKGEEALVFAIRCAQLGEPLRRAAGHRR